MNSYKGLLNKDWLLSKNWMMIGLFIMLGIILISWGFSQYYDNPYILFGVCLTIFSFHIFYIFAFFISSLILEGKTHLWLHSPQSTLALVSSKLLIAVFINVISISIFSLILYVVLKLYKGIIPYSQVYTNISVDIFFYSIGITIIGIYFGVLGLFYWVVYQSLGSVTFLKKWKGIVLIVIFLITNYCINKISQWDVYESILQFGPIPIQLVTQFTIGDQESGMSYFGLGPEMLSVGGIATYVTVVLGIIYVSSWLIDKVVEMT
ncbi:hypothetical protein ACWE42_13445 [Sutcliffiella cohnii]